LRRLCRVRIALRRSREVRIAILILLSVGLLMRILIVLLMTTLWVPVRGWLSIRNVLLRLPRQLSPVLLGLLRMELLLCVLRLLIE